MADATTESKKVLMCTSALQRTTAYSAAVNFCYKVNLNTMLLLVVLMGGTVLVSYSWYTQQTPPNAPLPQRKVHVLLLSSWRSGSSFLGQIFSQHESVFYLMEPAWHVWTRVQKSGARLLRMAVRDCLRSLYRCDFSVMDSYLPDNHRVSSLFMWYESRALCSPPACNITATNETQCRQKCDSEGLQKAKKACSTYSHVVLKETRLFELESLYPLLEDPNLDLRIVHLVRDPRAVMRSRAESAKSLEKDTATALEQQSMSKFEVQFKVMQEICSSHVRIYESAILKPPPFLKNRYKLVRYEDVARNPLKEVNDIYDFVGLKMTTEMSDWIFQKTHGKGKGTAKQAFQVVSRNATQVSEAWRTMLPHFKVKRVQEACKEAMSLLGYRTVRNNNEQSNLDMDLLVPPEPYKFKW